MATPLDPLPDELAQESPLSRLEPHKDLILALRRRKPPLSFRRLQQLLDQRYDVRVALSTLFEFVKIRARKKRDAQEDSPTPAGQFVAPLPPETPRPLARQIDPDKAAARAAAIEQCRAANSKPTVEAPTVTKVFSFDPDQPLVLLPSINKGEK